MWIITRKALILCWLRVITGEVEERAVRKWQREI